MQQLSSNEKMSYGRLYHYSWRNFLTLGLSLLFMLVSWGILNSSNRISGRAIGAVMPRWQDFRIGERVLSPAD